MADKNNTMSCWTCPLCPMLYKRRYHFDKHIKASHNLHPEEVSDAWLKDIDKDEYEQRMIQIMRDEKLQKQQESDKSPPKSEWGKQAFSTKFSCYFCGEIFKRDCNYVVHLQLNHKDEDDKLVTDLIEDINHYKLDGCEFKCVICGSKFSQHSSFIRHMKNHGITYKEYVEIYGNPETSSSFFECRICAKSMKRTRNIISQHMKSVHFLSWQQYR